MLVNGGVSIRVEGSGRSRLRNEADALCLGSRQVSCSRGNGLTIRAVVDARQRRYIDSCRRQWWRWLGAVESCESHSHHHM